MPRLLALFATLLVTLTTLGQTPNLANTVPAEGLAGEQVCFDLTLTNTGGPGFGPYVRLILPPDLTLASADFLGSGVTTQTVGTFPGSGNLTDPRSMSTVSGTTGDTLILLVPPIGSVVAGGPDLVISVCLNMSAGVTIGTPLPIGVQPMYEFGDTATGENGAIEGTLSTPTVTPTVAIFTKASSAAEGETAAGPSFPFTYTLTVNVANGQTIDNIDINDVLPATLQYVGPTVIGGGTGVSIDMEPSTITPGGALQVTATSITGTAAAADMTISFPVHAIDALDETNCATAAATNAATFDADFDSAPLPQAMDAAGVTIKHVAIQKGVTPGTAVPNDTLTYTINFQVSDFATSDSLVLVDTLPDGILFDAHTSLNIGGVVAIAPTVTPNGDGTTTVTYDITAAAGTLAAGTTGTLIYDAFVNETVILGDPVRAGDALANSVTGTYDLTAGASACTEGSAATVTIQAVVFTKTLLAPQALYLPGDTAVFRLEMSIPSGDSQNIVFEDFLPLPAFDATTIDTNTNLGANTSITYGATDTLGLTPTAITTDAGTNSVRIEWPDVDTTSPQFLTVDLSVVVEDEPAAPSLFLTNLFQGSSENSPGAVTSGLAPTGLTVGAPSLAITKGVSSSDNPNANVSPAPSTLPVDGDLSDGDTGDTVTFVITVENIGDAPAFDVTVTDMPPTGYTGCTLVSVLGGDGTPLTTSGDLFTTGLILTGSLPASNGVGAPFEADTMLITYTCTIDTVEAGAEIDNTASVTWASLGGSTAFPPEDDMARSTISSGAISKTITDTSETFTSGSDLAIGETVEYTVVVTVPEGTSSNVTLTDQLPTGMELISLDSLNTSSGDLSTDHAGGFAAVLTDATIGGSTNCGIGTNFSLPFDNVTNSNTNDGVAETITVVYTAVVCGAIAPSANDSLRNDAEWTSDNGSIDDDVNATAAVPVLDVTKTPSPVQADGDDVITYTVTIEHNAMDSGAPAFDLVITDMFTDADLTYVGGSLVAPGPATVVTGDMVSDTTIDIRLDELLPGNTYTFSFQAQISATVTAGDTVSNTVNVAFDTLSADGAANEASLSAQGPATVAIGSAVPSKAILSTSETSTGTGQYDAGLTDLTIGEQVTFRITTTLPEGTNPGVVVVDRLPATAAGVLEFVSVSIDSIGASLAPTNSNPTPTLTDESLNDGLIDTVALDFGSIVNTPDGVTDTDDQLVVDVVAQVVNQRRNRRGDRLTNTALVDLGTAVQPTASVDVELVEPLLRISKSGSINAGDAGDFVVVTIQIRHRGASRADAFDVTISEVLPDELIFAGSLLDTGTTPADTLNEAGGTVTATWSNFPLGSVGEIQFAAQIANSAAAGELITNRSEVTWDSLPGSDPEQRNGRRRDGHQILVGAPALAKTIVSTSEGTTGTSINGDEVDLAIGEQVTFEVAVTLPEGTTYSAIVSDQLPNAAGVLEVVSSQILSIGGNLSGAMLPVVGTMGTASDSDGDGVDDRVEWDLGEVLNTADGMITSDDQLTFEVVAVVLDVGENQGGFDDDLLNTASLDFSNGSLQDVAAFDLVEPRLKVSKTPVPTPAFGDASDTLTFELTIEHDDDSSADAFNVVVTDVLPTGGAVWGGDGNVTSTCTGIMVDSSGAPTISFTIPTLALADGSCTITYEVQIDAGATAGNSYQNDASMQYDSTSTFVSGQTRRGSDSASSVFTVNDPTVVKIVTDSDLEATGQDRLDNTLQDLAIGESVDYTITVVFSEGSTTSVTIVDDLPAGGGGVIEATGATIVSIGANLVPANPGTITFQDLQLADGRPDRVTFDFGDVFNVADGIDDEKDRLVVRVTGQVVEEAANVDGATPQNDVTLNFGGGGPLTDSATVDIVEPNPTLTKSLGPIVNGLVTITLEVENTGNAPLFDVLLTDTLNDTEWDVTSILPVAIPNGYTFTVVDNIGSSEVQIASDALEAPPTNSIEPGETEAFIFQARVLEGVASVSNSASLTGTSFPGSEPEERTYSDSDSSMLDAPVLDADKTVTLIDDRDMSSDISLGDQIEWTITLNNTGDGAANRVFVSDMLDASTTLVVGSVTTTNGTVLLGNTAGDTEVLVEMATVASMTSETVTFRADIGNTLPPGTPQISNQASITSDEHPDIVSDDPGTGAVDDPTIVPLAAAPDLSLSKDDGGATVAPGAIVVYTLSYANTGNQDASGVVITETVPNLTTFVAASSDAGWVCAGDGSAGDTCTLNLGTVAAGASGDVLFAVQVDATVPSGTTQISNGASIADDGSSGMDPTGNNTTTDTTPVDAVPDLQLTKTADVTESVPGATVTYTLTASNLGNQDATGVVLSETVPNGATFLGADSDTGWSCADGAVAGTPCNLTLGTLAAGSSVDLIFAVQLDNPLDPNQAMLSNTASITDDGSNGPDPNPGNNTGSSNIPLTVTVDLALEKDDNGSLAEPGEVLIYTLTYRSNGTQDLRGVTITETVPANTTFVPESSDAGWVCSGNAAGSSCTLTLGDLPAGSTGTVNYAVRVDLPLAAGVTEIENTARITDDGGNGAEATDDDNTVTLITFVDALIDLQVEISGPDDFDGAGDTLTYTLDYSNVGEQNATGVQIAVPAPSFLVLDPNNSTPGWVCVEADSVTRRPPPLLLLPEGQSEQTAPGDLICTFDIGALNVGDSGQLQLAFRIASSIPESTSEIDLTATIGDDGTRGADIDPANNVASTDTTRGGDFAEEIVITVVETTTVRPTGLCGLFGLPLLLGQLLVLLGWKSRYRRTIRR